MAELDDDRLLRMREAGDGKDERCRDGERNSELHGNLLKWTKTCTLFWNGTRALDFLLLAAAD